VETESNGGVMSAGIGAQIVFLTLGARARLSFFEEWQMGRVGGELGLDTITNDTTYKTENNFNIVPVSTEIYNPSNFNRVFFTDANFDGQLKLSILTFRVVMIKNIKLLSFGLNFLMLDLIIMNGQHNN
jgi:hypothetical protein